MRFPQDRPSALRISCNHVPSFPAAPNTVLSFSSPSIIRPLSAPRMFLPRCGAPLIWYVSRTSPHPVNAVFFSSNLHQDSIIPMEFRRGYFCKVHFITCLTKVVLTGIAANKKKQKPTKMPRFPKIFPSVARLSVLMSFLGCLEIVSLTDPWLTVPPLRMVWLYRD